ncbi:MAG TPA: class I SAM-dependent methyltransferase [Chthoniobacterales bacterium]|jgi:SAM-dependent methyltransferase|nr:class I SAM-dependent methyltransferase [Chthoniobacterales bacterium]
MRRDEYATMFRVEETHWWYKALHRLIFQTLEAELPDWREKEIVDVGCGTGAILKQLENPEKNVGVDLAPEAVSFCHQRGLNNVRQGDILALPFPDASFDAVICSSVLYHEWVTDVAGAVREMHRILRPGGTLLINVPAFPFLHSAHDEAVMTARRFRKREIRQLLLAQNFNIRRLTYWTTFLFPLAVAARTLGGSKMGRDFETEGTSFTQRTLGRIMALELDLLRKISLPFGVALLAVARK